jgi:hypothetical protein
MKMAGVCAAAFVWRTAGAAGGVGGVGGGCGGLINVDDVFDVQIGFRVSIRAGGDGGEIVGIKWINNKGVSGCGGRGGGPNRPSRGATRSQSTSGSS